MPTITIQVPSKQELASKHKLMLTDTVYKEIVEEVKNYYQEQLNEELTYQIEPLKYTGIQRR